MKGQLLVQLVLLLAVAAKGGLALQCYACRTYVCKEGEIEELRTCRTPPGTVSNQCVKFDGELSGSVGDNTVSFTGVIRSCNVLPDNIASLPNRCVSNNDATDYSQHLIDWVQELTFLDVGNIQVSTTGDLCFCADDGCNGVGSLKPFLWLILGASMVQLLTK